MSEITENPFNVLMKQMQRMETLIIELRQEVATTKQAATTTVKEKTGIALVMEVTGLAKSTIYNMVSSRTSPH
ncbi:MAG: hypothetical protein WD824_21090 [Cyclobacteriaceae bacterium]